MMDLKRCGRPAGAGAARRLRRRHDDRRRPGAGLAGGQMLAPDPSDAGEINDATGTMIPD